MRIDVDRLNFSYGRGAPEAARAVDNVDLAVLPGEHVALLGPSGSGKSTLLALLAGFLSPQSGTIRFDREVVSGERVFLAPRMRRTGMVFQDLALWPHMTVEDHLAFSLRASGVPRRERRRRQLEILELVDLLALRARRPPALSGGEAQRLALARALVTRPRLLLLDEPLGGLDRSLRAQMLLLVEKVHVEYGTTTIHVTHDFDEVAPLAARAAVLEGGKLVQVGSTEDLYRRPANTTVARLAGPANLVEGFFRSGDRVELELGVFRAAFSASVNERVIVLVRPDDLLIQEAAGGDFTVTRCRYQGHSWAVEVRRERLGLTALQGGPLVPGTRVRLSVREPVWGFQGESQ